MMAYYTRWDKTICEKLKHINYLLQEEWITPAEALATARALDPLVWVCDKCGAFGATGCDCTIEIPVEVIEEVIRCEQN